MPYATRTMLKYMKEHGLNPSEETASEPSGTSETSGTNKTKKKVRQLPSEVDPADEDKKKPKSSKPQKSASLTKSSTKKSSSTKPNSKAKSSLSASKSTSKKSKSGISSSSSIKSKSKSASTKSGSKSAYSKSKSSTMSSNKNKSSKSTKSAKVRVIQASTKALKPLDVPGMVNYNEMSYDEKKLQFIQSLLKSNVRRVKGLQPTDNVDDNAEHQSSFAQYSINKNKTLAKPHSALALYETTHKDFPPDCLVVCKLYDPKKVDPNKSLYLKILRHLGKKHPHIIQTWDIMLKGDTIYVFQEFAPYNNMQAYLMKKGVIDEEQTRLVAHQIRAALDFLGDMGISHRGLSPHHFLVATSGLLVKLTGFRQSIIYYDEKQDDINYQPCIPLSKRGKEDYQAPEVYGDPDKEEYDPMPADVWSFGATIYYCLSKKYPYDIAKSNPHMEDEIQKNVISLKKMSKNGQSALGHMLTISSIKRLSVDKLKDHPWMKILN